MASTPAEMVTILDEAIEARLTEQVFKGSHQGSTYEQMSLAELQSMREYYYKLTGGSVAFQVVKLEYGAVTD